MCGRLCTPACARDEFSSKSTLLNLFSHSTRGDDGGMKARNEMWPTDNVSTLIFIFTHFASLLFHFNLCHYCARPLRKKTKRKKLKETRSCWRAKFCEWKEFWNRGEREEKKRRNTNVIRHLMSHQLLWRFLPHLLINVSNDAPRCQLRRIPPACIVDMGRVKQHVVLLWNIWMEFMWNLLRHIMMSEWEIENWESSKI